MGFSNPASPGGAVEPFYRFRDEFFWPAVSGEQFPPLMSGLAPPTYSNLAGKPCYATTSSGLITFQQLPRVSALTQKTTLNIEFWVASGGGDIASNFNMTFGGTPGRPQITFAPYILGSTDAGGVARAVNSGIAAQTLASQGWYKVTISCLPDGHLTMMVNDVLVATEPTLVWPATLATNTNLGFAMNLASAACKATQVRVFWT